MDIFTYIGDMIKVAWDYINGYSAVRALVDFIKFLFLSPFRFFRRRRPEIIAPDHTQYVEDRIPYSNFEDSTAGPPVWRWRWFGTTIHDLHPYCPNCGEQMMPLPCLPRSTEGHINELQISPQHMRSPEMRFKTYMRFIRAYEPCEKNWQWCIECKNCIIERLPRTGRPSSGGGDRTSQDLLTYWTDRVREEIYRRASQAASE